MSDPSTTQERSELVSSLGAQREHILGILDGLSDEDLRRPVLPSGWVCLGLVQHLAVDVEQWWFRRIVAGQDIQPDESPALAWRVTQKQSAEAVFALYRHQIELANAIIAATPLDAAPAYWPEERWPNWRLHDLREVMLHVITETAVHAGHLDAVRELIDGRRWLVLTG
ncbi:MAG: DinB family protein [Candidatus Dormiibacterota bacterium]|jgi:hypothetical protein